ncbi:MAG: extracellular solute-binding protein [Anaerolineae bacterium]|nr:extracellular solute-binding protein [Anaerolineae bacterium]
MNVNKHFSRRDFLHMAGVGGAGVILAACATPTPQVIEKIVEKPVEKIVKETVVTEKQVEKIVQQTVVVEKEKQVEKVITATPAKGAKTTLRWWSYFSPQDRGQLFPTIAYEYEQAHPEIAFEQSHGSAGYNESLTTAIATGDPPELFMMEHFNWLLFAGENSALDLGDWYSQSGTKEKTHPAALAWTTFKGKLYGFSSSDLFVQEWYYNKAVFQKYGIQEPKTGDDLFAIGQALKGKVKFPMITSGGDSWTWVPFLLSPIQAQTVGIAPLLEANEKKDFNVPGLKETIEMVQRMFKEGMIPQDVLAIAVGDDIATYAQGDVGILPVLSAVHKMIMTAVETVPKDKVDTTVFQEAPLFTPQPKSKWAAGYGAIWTVPKNNKQLKATLDFLTFLASPAVQQRGVDGGFGISPLVATWDAIKDPLLRLNLKHLKEATGEALYWIDFLHPRVLEANGQAMRKMAQGQATPQEVIDAMNAAIRAI